MLIQVLRCIDLVTETQRSSLISFEEARQLHKALRFINQPTYVNSELRRMFDNILPQLQNISSDDLQVKSTSSSTTGDSIPATFSRNRRSTARIPISAISRPLVQQKQPSADDLCCICLESVTLNEFQSNLLVWCKARCANNLHSTCFALWQQTKQRMRDEVACPSCRACWIV